MGYYCKMDFVGDGDDIDVVDILVNVGLKRRSYKWSSRIYTSEVN